MDRTKSPALTSPWKIGFFASLLLVSLSIGVGYFMTRIFELQWNWLRLADGTWTFQKESFMSEMLPLVIVVSLLSLFSYFLITGAVRKYKAYCDSGLDYNNLIHSLHNVGDLEGLGKLKSLNKYPEMKEFLFQVRDQVAKREQALEGREQALEGREQALEGREQALANQAPTGPSEEELSRECAVLASAIMNVDDGGLVDPMALNISELKQVEDAVRTHMTATREQSDGASSDHLSAVRNDFQEFVSSFHAKIQEILAEQAASQDIAREIEGELGQIKDGAGMGESTAGAGDVTQPLARLDAVAEELRLLGEDTKGIAIQTALQVGSGQGISDLIQLADDLREVAARCGDVVEGWFAASNNIHQAVSASVGAGVISRPGEAVPEMIGGVVSKVGLWVERLSVLGENLKSFQDHHHDAASALHAKLGGDASPAHTDPAELELDSIVPSSQSSTPDADANVVQELGSADDFERQATPESLLDRKQEAGPEIEGIEQQKNLFEEIAKPNDEDYFADLPGNEEPAAAAEPVPAPEPAPPAVEVEPAPEEVPATEGVTAGEEASVDHEAAIDLYELGAVDYQPDNVIHNA